ELGPGETGAPSSSSRSVGAFVFPFRVHACKVCATRRKGARNRFSPATTCRNISVAGRTVVLPGEPPRSLRADSGRLDSRFSRAVGLTLLVKVTYCVLDNP